MTVLLGTIYSIFGYRITEKIYSGSKTLVYRGIREQDQQPVILKLMRNDYPTFTEIAQFRNQYAITKNIDLPGIVKPYSLENYHNGYALVMEDFGGISLEEWLLQKQAIGEKSLSLNEFFPIAIAIISTLEGLQRLRIIHKDIKPANILIQPSTGEVRIIDFSIATLLSREVQSLSNPNVLEGTLAYISPEQTGRMNRGIDYRTDFYSLGVTFFELLTGQLPFSTDDSMELVHCHIAKEPLKASSINSNIPPILSEIISKLMAKNAEDRYQSAYGLKHDLELCHDQWQNRGIVAFELGTQDISDNFIIPEKLYGRQFELATLLAAFQRVSAGATEMMLVSGFSGIGKTAIINEIHKPIARQGGYFIKGKFDQFQKDIPLSGIVQALRDLIGQLLSETDNQVKKWKTKILSALGTQGQVLIDIIPELELIIGQQPEVTELSGNAAQNRFNLLFQRFFQVFTTKEQPLVLFLDDLQWADVTSLKFLQLLMSETTSATVTDDIQQTNITDGSLLLIGAYRDNEVSPAHPLCLTLKEIEKTGSVINNIALTPLQQNDLNCLVADTLRCEKRTAFPLTQMVFAKTKGNPFFSNQFLKSLHKDGLITFNFEANRWHYNLAQLQALAITDDVVEFMTIQIGRLSETTQEVLKLAACIGNEFDLRTLSIVYEKSTVDTAFDLWIALHEGFILPQNEIYKLFQEGQVPLGNIDTQNDDESFMNSLALPRYKFVHDRVQQAAYALIPEYEKKPIHLKIGLLLLNNIPVAEREDKIFELVNQFNIAVELITDKNQRHDLAEMNLTAGRKALASTAYQAALKYLTTGIELLADDSWEKKYELTLALYETASEAAYLAGEYEQMEEFIEVVLTEAKTLLETVKVLEVKIQAYGVKNQGIEAINTGIAFLKLLGVALPENPSQVDVQLAMAEVALNMNGRSIEDLTNLPEMTEATTLAGMRILSSLSVSVYQASPQLFPLIILKEIELSLKYGNTSLSAYAYVIYGLILCGSLGDIESGYRFGDLALRLTDKFNAQELKAKMIDIFYGAISHWKEHTKDILNHLLQGYSIGLQTGDLEFASYCLYSHCYAAYFIGQELTGLESAMASYSNAISNLNQERAFNWHAIYWQSILNLLKATENPCCLIGEAYNEEKMLAIHQQTKDGTGLLYFHINKLILCYLFYDFQQAIDNSQLAENYLESGVGNHVVPLFHFYDSLVRLAIYHDKHQTEQNLILDTVQTNQVKMQMWAHHAPMNYLHKYCLVEAERSRVSSQYLEAIDYYDRAISLAKENEYLNEEALANELAARFYLEWGKQKIAQTYLIDAYYCYSRWGAKAKVEDLAKRYPQLLAPIIQQEKLGFHPSEKTTHSHSKSLSSLSNQQTILASKASISDSLDLASVIKASQALSGEIELEQLISTLMRVVMENAGASKGGLILSKGNHSNLKLTAVSYNSQTKFPGINLESSNDVPVTLINYVKRTLEILVIDDAKANISFADDRYIIREQPKSILCIPIINQSKILGIIYLENNLTTGAFTRSRVELLKLLTTQAAISLENAILYTNLAEANENLEEYNHKLEEKVAVRTQELNEKNQHLQQALEELQRTQTQLIQSEKMSSLGQMVAGIAHEINNPINFIHGNITHASEYVKDLLDVISVYQQEYPHPSPLVEEKNGAVDVDFLLEDLPKLLDSMKVGSSRIRNIVLGLRNFSRLDESDMKPVDIHEGIDNTLMILQHRINGKNERPEIAVIKEYGQMPQVSCYAGQLNQVFMNILSNAIDALDEGIGNSKLHTPTIRIRTELVNNQTVKIQIADNGVGMTETVRQKVFDPFFTTKPVGSGTGLGLSISYQVVVDKHKGQLSCNSTPGEGTEFVIEIPMQ
jgi:predicted ATPase/signal transduction histidine kinase